MESYNESNQWILYIKAENPREQFPRSILIASSWHFREDVARVGRGCHEDATSKLLPWNLGLSIVVTMHDVRNNYVIAVQVLYQMLKHIDYTIILHIKCWFRPKTGRGRTGWTWVGIITQAGVRRYAWVEWSVAYVCLFVHDRTENDLSYQHDTWYTHTVWQVLGMHWSCGPKVKGQGHRVMKCVSGVMHVDTTALVSTASWYDWPVDPFQIHSALNLQLTRCKHTKDNTQVSANADGPRDAVSRKIDHIALSTEYDYQATSVG